MLGVHPETVLRWTRDGKLPAFRLPGGAIRYREDDLEDWLEGRATDSLPARVEPSKALDIAVDTPRL